MLDQEEKHVKIAFAIYQKFFRFHYKHTTDRTFIDFIESKFYLDFVKFGRHVLNINAIRPDAFAEFLFRNAVPLKKWCVYPVYETFVREMVKKEDPLTALERTLLLVDTWVLDTGEPRCDFLRKIAAPRAVDWLRSGRISPWFFYAANSAQDLLNRFSKEQRNLVQEALDTEFWSVKISEFPGEFQAIRAVLLEEGF